MVAGEEAKASSYRMQPTSRSTRSPNNPNMDTSSLALPSDYQLGKRSKEAYQSEQLKSARVQEQVRTRLIQKSQTPAALRPNGSVSNYGESRESKTSRYQYGTMPAFSSRSQVLSTEQKTATFRPVGYSTGKAGNWSSRSAVDGGVSRRISTSSQMRQQGQTGQQGYTSYNAMHTARPTSFHERSHGRRDFDTMSLRSLRIGDGPVTQMGVDDRYSMMSEQMPPARSYYGMQTYAGGGSAGGGGNAYRSSYVMEKQVSTSAANPALQRSGSRDGAGWVDRVEVTQNRTIRAPAMRTLQRFQSTNRSRLSTSSFGNVQQGSGVGASYQGMIEQNSRAPSVRSLVEASNQMQDLRGMDMFDGNQDLMTQQSFTGGFDDIDMPSAVKYLMASDANLQVLGAAYIQHKCYSDNDAKKQARSLQAIPKLVKLFNHSNHEVQRHATGAMRNLIYDSPENKMVLVEENGIYELMLTLKEQDDELRKNATGILWNLSSSDNLKDRLARDTLEQLTDRILTPLSGSGNSAIIQQNASESEIFYNATGFLRNLSSASEQTRQKMRECHGLVDAMVSYINRALEAGKSEDKSVENAVCVLRNLSYRLYDEMPPSSLQRLEGNRKNPGASNPGEMVGCFTPQSKKLKEHVMSTDMVTFTEVSKDPKGMEWLWNPQIIGVYNRLLQRCELNKHTTEAAAGALQNITAGDRRWAGVLSRVALEQERILNPVLDRVRTADNQQLRSLTGLIRNLSRNAKNKDEMSTKVVSHLVEKLPSSNSDKSPSTEVLVNIIAVLNNLVVESPIAARDLVYFDGLKKLVYIKNKRDSPDSERSSRAASNLLANMWQYSKLHRDFKAKGYRKEDFLSP
ncbi:plakophilin-3 isoform X2 [Rhinatrema bivittatum]|uniref:plakophilin-3 isoform X2 n=1 Tax=Rhinatrema bivittatum TaxID=194408 RepID=UPI00112EB58C|nr:plakophilin-3 isoform X2 [Rhinatrema bivittatum]